MRVAVLDRQVPFEPAPRGDGHADRLCHELREHGHAVTLVRIPFCASSERSVVDQMLAVRLLRLENVERAVGIGFPAYFVRHEQRVVWMLRGVASLDGCRAADGHEPPSTALRRSVRRSILAAEHAYLGEATRILTRSVGAGRRLRRVSGVDSQVLQRPLCDPERFRCDRYGDYLLAPGPLAAGRGQRLALAALALSASGLRLVLSGPPRGGGDVASLRALAGELGIGERVEILPRAGAVGERARLLAGARAVLCLEGDADGPRTLEAFQSRKAVIAVAEDAGPPALVRAGVSGLLATSAAGLAAAIDELAGDAATAERYGAGAFGVLRDADITWSNVVAELTR